LGAGLLHETTIASMCLMDCRTENWCEIGIRTDETYRRQGLAALAVAGLVEHCLDRGINQIGWHCLRNNVGSRRTAEKVGFTQAAEYPASSATLPAENLGDLSPAEAQAWARHYEAALVHDPKYHLDAAVAWALAGAATPALAQLRQAINAGINCSPAWLQSSWAFTSLRPVAEFQALIAELQGT